MDDLLSEFVVESLENLSRLDLELVELENDPENMDILNSIFRTMHTIKGTCGFIGLARLEKLAHASENVLVRLRDKKLQINEEIISAILQSVDGVKYIINTLSETSKEPDGGDDALIQRLESVLTAKQPESESKNDFQEASSEDFEKLFEQESPIDLTLPENHHIAEEKTPDPQKEITEVPEEKVKEAHLQNIQQNQTQTIRVNINTLENLIDLIGELVLTRNQLMQVALTEENSALSLPLYRLNYVTSELQEQVMKTRMQPIGNAWLKLPRIVRDASNELNKKIELELSGAETELDRQVIELIKDPLTHMIRNAMDHGIESPEERLHLGKPDKGVIAMKAYHAGGHIIIEISDDGRGLSVDKIKKKAIENGFVGMQEAESLTDSQIFSFIFKSGLSTAERVSNISGRGVGMDVVRTNIEKIGGNIDIRSKPLKGSTFVIKIPLTLSIVSALVAEVGEYRFAIPQLNVLELVNTSGSASNKIEYINGHPVLRLRNKLLTLVHMEDLLGLKSIKSKNYVIVLQVGTTSFGIVVDKVFNTQEIVVKPVSSLIRHLSIFAGNTILGDGSVIMILDPNHIANTLSNIHLSDEDVQKEGERKEGQEAVDSETFLLFKADGAAPKAVPLSTITRLEKIRLTDVEYTNNAPCIQYRDRLMALYFLGGNSQGTNQVEQKPVLVFSNQKHIFGLVVDEILDIVEGNMDFKLSSENDQVLGVNVLKGKAVEVINTDYYLHTVFQDWYSSGSSNEKRNKHLLFLGDAFYGSNFLVPFLKRAGYHVQSLSTIDDLKGVLSSYPPIDAFIIDDQVKGTPEVFDYIAKQDTYSFLPKIQLLSSQARADHVGAAVLRVNKDSRAEILETLQSLFIQTNSTEIK